MKFYLDCEFNDKGVSIELISIAIVCETGRKIHIALDFNQAAMDEWLTANVLPHLNGMARHTTDSAQRIISSFMVEILCGSNAEFWGYYCAHDWYLLCRLFGGMMKLPREWGMYCREMMQLPGAIKFDCAGDIHEKNHNALFDAQWMRDKHAEVIGQPRIFGLW